MALQYYGLNDVENFFMIKIDYSVNDRVYTILFSISDFLFGHHFCSAYTWFAEFKNCGYFQDLTYNFSLKV